jgi:hypothetical protein
MDRPPVRSLLKAILAAVAIAVQIQPLSAGDPLAEARALNQQAIVLDEQGRHAEAEPIFARALAIREKALGPDHPDVAESACHTSRPTCAGARACARGASIPEVLCGRTSS